MKHEQCCPKQLCKISKEFIKILTQFFTRIQVKKGGMVKREKLHNLKSVLWFKLKIQLMHRQTRNRKIVLRVSYTTLAITCGDIFKNMSLFLLIFFIILTLKFVRK